MRMSKQTWKTAVLAVGLSLGLVTISFAQGPTDEAKKGRRDGQKQRSKIQKPVAAMDMAMFHGADVDGDGSVNQDEFQAFLAERQSELEEAFLKADTNGDGSVDRAEMQAVAEQQRMEQAQRMFQMMDKDGDGAVAKDEFRGKEDIFDAADSDADGSLSPQEWSAHLKQQIQQRMQKARDNRPDGEKRAQRKSPFDQLDLNGDGTIDETEAGEKKAFIQRFDTDGNGSVTREEFQSAMQERMKNRKQDANTDRKKKQERKGKNK